MPTWLQVTWPLVLLVVGYLLPRLTTKGQAGVDAKILKIEQAGFTVDYKVALESKLTRIETLIQVMRDNQKDYFAEMERSLADAAHSDHTPELDVYLDKLRDGQDLTIAERSRVIKMLDELIARPDTNSGKRSSYATLRGIMLSNLKRKQRELRASAA